MKGKITLMILSGLLLICIALSIIGFQYYNKDDILLKVKSETAHAKQRCFDQAFPGNAFNMYGDDLKVKDSVYHQCLKKEIINHINQIANKDDAEKLTKSLDEIQDGILNFYWELYNRQDYGSIGRGVNDASLGRYYEQILEDIIHFQYIFNTQRY